MKIPTTLMKLCAASALTLASVTVTAETVTEPTAGGSVPATGWYPAQVIDERGMDRYLDAWNREPCMNGAAGTKPAATPPAATSPAAGAEPPPSAGEVVSTFGSGAPRR